MKRIGFGFLVGTLLIMGFLVLLIARGIWDPEPIGTLQQTVELGLVTASVDVVDVPEMFTVQVELISAESQAGLTLHNATDSLTIAVDPLGYLSIWLPNSRDAAIYPWQTWPHVNSEHNEIWLDAGQDEWVLSINRERFYVGEPLLDAVASVGVWVQDSAEIPSLKLFYP